MADLSEVHAVGFDDSREAKAHYIWMAANLTGYSSHPYVMRCDEIKDGIKTMTQQVVIVMVPLARFPNYFYVLHINVTAWHNTLNHVLVQSDRQWA